MFLYYFKAKFWSPSMNEKRTIKIQFAHDNVDISEVFKIAVERAYAEISEDEDYWEWDLLKISLKKIRPKEG